MNIKYYITLGFNALNIKCISAIILIISLLGRDIYIAISSFICLVISMHLSFSLLSIFVTSFGDIFLSLKSCKDRRWFKIL